MFLSCNRSWFNKSAHRWPWSPTELSQQAELCGAESSLTLHHQPYKWTLMIWESAWIRAQSNRECVVVLCRRCWGVVMSVRLRCWFPPSGERLPFLCENNQCVEYGGSCVCSKTPALQLRNLQVCKSLAFMIKSVLWTFSYHSGSGGEEGGKAADGFELLENTGHYLKKVSESCSPWSCQ